MKNKAISDFFKGLGFNEEETRVYIALNERGILTTLELSRATGISRTQVYRLLEDLKSRGVVEEVVDEHRIMARAIDVEHLYNLVKTQKQQVSLLDHLFPDIKQLLTANTTQKDTDTKVQFYRGKNGLRQMVWHTLRTESDIVGYTYRDISEIIGEDFMQDWVDSFVNKKLFMRDIYSDHFIKSFRESKRHIDLPDKYNLARYISPKILDVHLQIDIYNDVTAHYNWFEGETFGVEIYNAKIASFHRQIFEIIWKQAKPKSVRSMI